MVYRELWWHQHWHRHAACDRLAYRDDDILRSLGIQPVQSIRLRAGDGNGRSEPGCADIGAIRPEQFLRGRLRQYQSIRDGWLRGYPEMVYRELWRDSSRHRHSACDRLAHSDDDVLLPI